MDLFWRCSFIIFSSTIYFEGGDCGTVRTSASLNANITSSVDFTCTYTLERGDSMASGLIFWQAKKSGTSDYENIARFSPPGGGTNFFTPSESAMNLKDRAELLDVYSVGLYTFRVVMKVREVECLDEKEYRCLVTFLNPNTGPRTETAVTSLTVQAPAKQPYEILAPDLSNIEENTTFNLSCTADVGKPPGKIKWWRYRHQIIAPFLVAESLEIRALQPGVCVYNVTFTIQPLVTKDDDQSVWRCSVDNELLTNSPDQDKPNQETTRINVYYKVGVPKITKSPDTTNSQYYVGSNVTLTCVANGNPNPSTNSDINKYVWTFKANPGGNETELSSTNGVLSLNNLQETDTGTYTCIAFNGFNGKVFNSSFEQELKIVYRTATSASTEWSTETLVTKDQQGGGDSGTVHTSASIKATVGSSVDLTCQYTLGPDDSVYSGFIAWQAKISGSREFENIATFSPSGGGNNYFTTSASAMKLRNRAELLDITSTGSNTFRVVLRVKAVQYLDEKEYRCSVTFISPRTGPRTDTAETFLTVQGGDSGTVHTSASIKATVGSSVDLTCQYRLGPDDSVYSGFIAWQAKISGSREYENIATFSPSGGGNNYFTTSASAMKLRNRAELLDITSTGSNTFRVVLRVKAVQYLDEKEYRCSVTFISPRTGPRTDTAETFLTVQAKNAGSSNLWHP